MPYNPDVHHRRSIRLKDFDYSQAGAYFVTINVEDRECLFGEIMDGVIQLNSYGEIAHSEWLKTSELRPNIVLDEFVVMPNHFHAILFIVEHRGVLQYAPTDSANNTVKPSQKPKKLQSPSQTIGAIVRGFKGSVTKKVNILRGTPEYPLWQTNYHERIIRDETELNIKREYIINNPLKWDTHEENPARAA
jgi:putative transposase